ncbi:MAG: Bug family tripartite tricarboxylate transporter substrate binding protein [Burkholderiales bacterium]
MKTQPSIFITTGFAMIAVAMPSISLAQNFPNKAMRIVVPFPPASGLDTMGRLVAQKLSESFGQAVVVENRAGANGMIGSEMVARSAPDGYTLLTGTSSTHASSPFSIKNLSYDPVKDFTPITAGVTTTIVLAAATSLPVNSVKELLEYGKKNPGKLTYSSSGTGGALHMVAEMFKSSFSIDILHVPYKGSAPAITALATGEVSLAFNGTSESVALYKAGKIKILAVAEPKRYVHLPEVPALAETLPNYERPPGWFGFFGPTGLPQPVLARLNSEIVKALNTPDVNGKLDQIGLTVIGNSPAEFAALLKRSIELYSQAAKLAGVKPE